MKKRTNLNKIFFLNLFEKRKLGTFPRIFLSSILVIISFYSAPVLIEFSKDNTWEKNKFKITELINEN